MVSILSAIKYISVLMRIYYKAFYKEVRLVYKIDLKQFNNRQKSRHTCLKQIDTKISFLSHTISWIHKIENP